MVRKLFKNLLLHFSSEVQTLLLQHAVALCQNNLRLQLNKTELYKGFFLHVEDILYIFVFSSLFTGLHSKGLLLNKNTPLLLMVCWSVSSCFLHFSPSHRQSRTSAQKSNLNVSLRLGVYF